MQLITIRFLWGKSYLNQMIIQLHHNLDPQTFPEVELDMENPNLRSQMMDSVYKTKFVGKPSVNSLETFPSLLIPYFPI